VWSVWLKNKHGRQPRQGKKAKGSSASTLRKIVLGAPDFLKYGVLMGKGKIS